MYNKLLNSVAKKISKIAVKKNYSDYEISELVKKYADRFGLRYDSVLSSVSMWVEFLTGLKEENQ